MKNLTVFLWILLGYTATGFAQDAEKIKVDRNLTIKHIALIHNQNPRATVTEGWNHILMRDFTGGITNVKIYTSNSLSVHVIYGIASAATNSKYFNDGVFFFW